MKVYVVNFVETLQHTYYYEAETAEDAMREFDKDLYDGNIELIDDDCCDSEVYVHERKE